MKKSEIMKYKVMFKKVKEYCNIYVLYTNILRKHIIVDKEKLYMMQLYIETFNSIIKLMNKNLANMIINVFCDNKRMHEVNYSKASYYRLNKLAAMEFLSFHEQLPS